MSLNCLHCPENHHDISNCSVHSESACYLLSTVHAFPYGVVTTYLCGKHNNLHFTGKKTGSAGRDTCPKSHSYEILSLDSNDVFLTSDLLFTLETFWSCTIH